MARQTFLTSCISTSLSQSRTSGRQGPTPMESPIHLTWLCPLPRLPSVLSDMLFTFSLPSSPLLSLNCLLFSPHPPLLPCSDKMPKKPNLIFTGIQLASDTFYLPFFFITCSSPFPITPHPTQKHASQITITGHRQQFSRQTALKEQSALVAKPLYTLQSAVELRTTGHSKRRRQ